MKKVIRENQWDILRPKNGISNSEDWDITIIKVVIQYELHLLAPKNCWENPIDVFDVSTAADVCRGKEIRNRLKHATVKTLANTSVYNNILTEIEKILRRLGYQNMQLFRDIQTGSLSLFLPQIMKVLDDKVDIMNNDVNGQMDGLKNDVYAINKKITDFQEEVHNIRTVINEIKTNVGKLVGTIESEFKRIMNKVASIIKKMEVRIINCETNIQNIQDKIHKLEVPKLSGM